MRLGENRDALPHAVVENLCAAAVYHGYTRDGGYTTHAIADARYCFPLGEAGDDAEIAPWLCAGLIGWRSYRMAGEGTRLGIYGFGAAAHILAQVARWQGREVFAFTRKGDTAAQDFARLLGAVWAGGADEAPEPLDAAIIFAPVGSLILPTAVLPDRAFQHDRYEVLLTGAILRGSQPWPHPEPASTETNALASCIAPDAWPRCGRSDAGRQAREGSDCRKIA